MCIRDRYYGIRYPQPATLLDHLDSPIFVLDEVGGIRDAQKATESVSYTHLDVYKRQYWYSLRPVLAIRQHHPQNTGTTMHRRG